MKLNHIAITFAIALALGLVYSTHDWPIWRAYYGYNNYLRDKAWVLGADYCDDYQKRHFKDFDTFESYVRCVKVVADIKLARLKASSTADQRWPDLDVMLWGD